LTSIEELEAVVVDSFLLIVEFFVLLSSAKLLVEEEGLVLFKSIEAAEAAVVHSFLLIVEIFVLLSSAKISSRGRRISYQFFDINRGTRKSSSRFTFVNSRIFCLIIKCQISSR
jgi:hypothetical protein